MFQPLTMEQEGGPDIQYFAYWRKKGTTSPFQMASHHITFLIRTFEFLNYRYMLNLPLYRHKKSAELKYESVVLILTFF